MIGGAEKCTNVIRILEHAPDPPLFASARAENHLWDRHDDPKKVGDATRAKTPCAGNEPNYSPRPLKPG
jgi:hypothetical protein